MRAVRYERFGGPEVLQLVEVDPPEVRPGTVRIRVRAAGVNPADWKAREGLFSKADAPRSPAGVGLEAAGTVEAVGAGVSGVEVGDEVFGFGRGTIAELAVLDVWAPRPDDLPVEEAAATPVSVETAIRLLDAATVDPGDTVVVSGASGGVGSAAVQLIRSREAIAIGTASAANQDYVEALGGIATTYGDGWVDRVRRLAVAEVDAGLDVAGAGVIPQLIELTGDPARVASVADPSATHHGAAYTSGGGDRAFALEEAVRLHRGGALRMIVERRYSIEQTPQALEDAHAGHARGRSAVVLEP